MRGFTLIEVMIVVGIIGILSAVSLPAYQDYSVRAKVSEVILALSACRTTIAEVYQAGGAAPGAGNWGCESPGSRYVAALTTDDDGVAIATLANIATAVDGKNVRMIPMINGAPANAAADMGRSVNAWSCGGAGTDLAMNYLPASCRGS